MKKLSYLLSAGILVAMLAIVGCSKDDGGGITPEDAAGANFAGTWAVGSSGSVTFDTDDRTSEYTNFTLTVNYSAGQGSGTYTATGGQSGASPWPTSGTWSFNSDTPGAQSFAVTRDDGLVVNVGVTATNLDLNFTFDDGANQGSRVENVNGSWTFNLVKQ